MKFDKFLEPRPVRVDTLCTFFLLLFPELIPDLQGDERARECAIEQGMTKFKSWGQALVAKKYKDALHLTDDACQQFVVVVLETDVVAKYQPVLSKPTTFFGTIFCRIVGRLIRAERRSFVPLEGADALEHNARLPVDVIIDREAIGNAIERYRKLGPHQRSAVVKLYPFLDETNPGIARPPRLEYVDRHRGLSAIRQAVLDKYRS